MGFGLETYRRIEDVAAQLRDRGLRIDREIIRYEAGNVVSLVDQDGFPTYVNEFPPEMLERGTAGGRAAEDLIAGGHAIVFVSNMDAAVRFYTETLGLKLTNRFDDNIAFVEAGRLVIAIHPKTPHTPDPGARGSVALGLTIDEPIDRVVSRLSGRGVRMAGSIVRTETDRVVEFEDPDGNSLYLWETARTRPQKPETSEAVVSNS